MLAQNQTPGIPGKENSMEQERISSYSEVYGMGHKALTELFSGPVVVEEKIDGSQISFGRQGSALLMRSKGKQLCLDAPEKMFEEAVASVRTIFDNLPDGVTFRGEYLKSPKHNTLAYSRTPSGHIMVFDIDRGNQDYASPQEKRAIAASFGLETVPLIFAGEIKSVEQLKSLLPETSILGGAKPEGIVIKNYTRFAHDKKILMGKYVRPEFAETNKAEWKKSNPTQADIIQVLIGVYRTEARWEKAVQHLRDAGKLQQAPQDIGLLLKEVEADIEKECRQEIADALWRWGWEKIARGAKAGLPEWYKNKLLESAVVRG